MIFSFPMFPEAWAKPKAIKILHDEIRHRTVSDFKGSNQNILIKQQAEQAKLTIRDPKEKAIYTSPILSSRISFTDVGAHWLTKWNKYKYSHPSTNPRFQRPTNLDKMGNGSSRRISKKRECPQQAHIWRAPSRTAW
ncbi:hypothetical protein [Thermoflavimicrobium dichotomicum]|uniref:hypothetical protein n=1 Tax=Thermoflavimicrobium dichotomicum TaxID=46223 RepID=UPI000B81769C|nr:hypothetical protein [Thermoflavimicrobium dichotomicum]